MQNAKLSVFFGSLLRLLHCVNTACIIQASRVHLPTLYVTFLILRSLFMATFLSRVCCNFTFQTQLRKIMPGIKWYQVCFQRYPDRSPETHLESG